MSWLLLLFACGVPEPCTAHGTTLGVSWQAAWTAPLCDSGLEPELQAVADEIEQRLWIYADGSELHAVRDGVGPIEVSEPTYRLVREALYLAEITGGAFDPTVEPLVQAYGFGLVDDPQPPDAEELDVVLERIGYEAVQIGRTDGAPWVDSGDRALDLSSMLEGQVADAMGFRLAREGLGSHLITVGDEHRAGGNSQLGPWRVGLDVAPGEPGSDLVLPLSAGGLAVSHGGKKLVDPKTGQLHDTDVLVAIVWAGTATRADGLATAVVVSGVERGLAIIEAQPDAEALVITAEGQDKTSGFATL